MKSSNLHRWILSAWVMLSAMGTAYGQLSTGLLNYWNLEGNYNDIAGTIPGGSSTFADNGTPINGNATIPATAGPLGRYLNCNRSGPNPGFTTAVSVPNSADVLMGGRSLSISLWLRISAFNANWQAPIAHGEGSDYRIARNGGNANMAYAGGTGDISGGGAFATGTWHHVVAITEAGVGTRLWVDNVNVATGTAGAALTNNGSTQMLIGGNPGADAGAGANQFRCWNGDIDDIGMWSRVLTPAEIGDIYTQGLTGVPLSTLFIPPDTDGDGLPDFWETLYGLSPTDNGTSPPGNVNNGPAGDPDGDGLTNLFEFTTSKTKPNNADSDGDTLTDGAEVNTHLSNPNVADTDGDGLPDGAEVNTYLTSPILTDTDGDGMPDGAEVAKGSNPAIADSGLDFGLVSYWQMDADFNSSVGGVTATPMGATLPTMVPGKFGNAVQLNGVDQFLKVDGDENKFDFLGGQSFSVAAWFMADTIDKDWQCLVAKGDSSGSWRFHRRGDVAVTPTQLSFCGGAGDLPQHTTPIVNGQWHHVVGVSRYGIDVKLYIDGALVATGGPPAREDRPNAMMIGANPDTTPGRFWTGKVDDLGVWCRGLSAAEVAQMWNGGTGTTIDELIDPRIFQFTNIVRNPADGAWTLSWVSRPGKNYTLNYSTDLVDFGIPGVNGGEIIDGIPSGGATTTFGPFPDPAPSSNRIQFKVKQN